MRIIRAVVCLAIVINSIVFMNIIFYYLMNADEVISSYMWGQMTGKVVAVAILVYVFKRLKNDINVKSLKNRPDHILIKKWYHL